MKLFHFALQNTSQTLLRSPCHDSPRLNSASKHVRPCYLFALIDGRSAALAARGSDSPLSDLLPLLPSAPRELTLILLDRNVFTANSLWIFQWRMCWNWLLWQLTEVDPAVGGPPIRRSLADTQTHTKYVLFCLFVRFCFIFCGCCVATSARWLTWLSFVHCL